MADLAENAQWTELAEQLSRADSPQVDKPQADGMTALLWATWHDATPSVKLLLDCGARAEVMNHYGVQPLALACLNGNAEIAAMLIDHGADPKAQTKDGETMLMTAARTGSLPCVRLLIQRGAEVEAKERKGQTALMWAAHEGHAPVVKELIQAGANPSSQLSSGFTPLLFAARQGHGAVVAALVAAGVDVNQALQRSGSGGGKAPRNGSSALILAVENGHFEVALQLIKLGADPNDQRSGYAPLHMLTWVRKPNRGDGEDGDPAPIGSGKLTSLQFAREAIDLGANPNARLKKGPAGRGQLNHTGATPLLLAAHTADLPYLKLLIEAGGDPRINNADQCTPLMAAAGIGVLAPGEEAGTEEEALQTIAFLADLGLSVNAVDENSETAMHGAAYKSLPRMVRWLHEHGADRGLWAKPNKYGWTPMDIAKGHRPGNFKPNEDVQQALQEISP